MKKYILFFAVGLLFFASCKEEGRWTQDEGGAAPGKVTNVTSMPLYGGARFYFDIPSDENLMSIDAVYTKPDGKSFKFSVSYFKDSIDVYGMPDVQEYTVNLYAVNRAGVRSEPTPAKVTPLEPAFSRVAQSIVIKPGFSSFFMDWVNELEQNINVYVDFSYGDRSFTQVFSSNLAKERRFIENLFLAPTVDVKLGIRVEDIYGNITQTIDKGKINLFEDIEIPKANWIIPEPNDSMVGGVNGGVPQGFGNQAEGRLRYLIDGVPDIGDKLNFMHTGGRGRTGNSANGNMPWNIHIDMGAKYQLSRIVTHQRHYNFGTPPDRGQLYRNENVGLYRIWLWDDVSLKWDSLHTHKIPVPQGLSELEFYKLRTVGDMAYMYPDEPNYTPAVRWFRYEALKSFDSNYTQENANCLSEITLFGRKAN